MDASSWDERYRSSPLVWSAGPNQFVAAELGHLPPGRAVDLACGEGRNAIWLASRGWTVTGADFSPVAIEKAKALSSDVTWVVADVLTWDVPECDLAVFAYLQLPGVQLRTAVRSAANALAAGGVLLVVGHDLRNLNEGTGGPQDASVLYSPDDVVSWLPGGMVIEKALTVEREVEGAERPALDVLVRAHRAESDGSA